jgi:glyoxylase-like metal-dependent hydrolase (beta-lactamase superfamily II)
LNYVLVCFGLLLLPGAASAQAPGTDFSKIEILTQRIAPNLYLLSGSEGGDPNHQDAAGGRIGVLAGPDGILMVDAQYGQLSSKVLAAVRHISPAPIRILVNTHIHIDHTGGNAFFAGQGATIFARTELRDEMLHPPPGANGNPAAARDSAGLPVVTYGMGAPLTIHLNGETVDFIPVKALDETIKIARADTKLVPGHGTIIDRTALIPYRSMIVAIQGRVQQMIAQGKTLNQVLAAKVTSDYDTRVAGGLLPAGAGTSADRFVSEIYQKLKGRR